MGRAGRDQADAEARLTEAFDTLPFRSRALLALAFTRVDDKGDLDATGEPPSAMKTLKHLSGLDAEKIRAALFHLERAGFITRTFTRRPRGRHLRVRVHLDRIKGIGACAECGSPARGTGQWCARCKQLFGRDDRAWQIQALELFGVGLSPPRIAARLNVPLFVARAVDGREAGGAAVVPFLVNHPELAGWPEREAWALRLREMGKGSGIE